MDYENRLDRLQNIFVDAPQRFPTPDDFFILSDHVAKHGDMATGYNLQKTYGTDVIPVGSQAGAGAWLRITGKFEPNKE